MKILVVCQYYYPERFRINDICEQLAKKGHAVTVLTGLPNYPAGRVPAEYRWFKKRREIINDVKVMRCFELGRKTGTFSLALNYVSFMIAASVKALFISKDIDIIFVYQLSPVTMALAGIVMKKRTKKPLYLYCCDIWPESAKIKINNEKSVVFCLLKRISKYIYSRCDMISVTSRPFIDYLADSHKISADKINYMPQHAEDDYMNIRTSKNNDTVDFVFMGNIGMAQDIGCILSAAEHIKQTPGFKIHFVGDGSCLNECKLLAAQKGLEGIAEFHGSYPLEQIHKFYSLADVCILTLKADSLIGHTIPSKLQGYMAAGKPVIGAIDGPAREIIEESGCGICVSAGDSIALAGAMREFIINFSAYKDCGEKGRLYYNKHFTKEMYISKLEVLLEELAKG